MKEAFSGAMELPETGSAQIPPALESAMKAHLPEG
jgi:hypothetical protein